jgi:glycosyl hydrolase family 12
MAPLGDLMNVQLVLTRKDEPPMTLRRVFILLAALGLVVAAPAYAATWSSSKPDAMWSNNGYILHNNMWNADGYNVSQTMYANSYKDWRVTAKANNASGDGAVKTYPNVHRDYHNWSTGKEPRLSAFKSIKSSFAARTPHVGIYNTAFDIWLNGVADGNSTEVMVWTDNYRQVPAGSVVAKDLSFSGHTWKLYATKDNSYLAFKPSSRITHDTINLKAMLKYLASKSRIPSRSTLGQICYGFEIVSTGGDRRTFKVDDFSVSSPKR